MQYIKVDTNVQRKIQSLIQQQPFVAPIIQTLIAKGATVLIIGGAVRDLLLNKTVKDLDFEVHRISLPSLQAGLAEHGAVSLVGKSFGVLRLHGLSIDWAIPRRDSSGRKPEVVFDTNLSFEDAFRRRDLTINAMGINVATYELIDPFNGLDDLERGILRAPDTAFFVQDPLRFFRVMQFIARFEMVPDEDLNKVCATMDISTISKERIEQEFNKTFLLSTRPSLAFRWLDSLGRLHEIMPQLAATKGVAQDPAWHPEGDVFEHTMQAIDAGSQLVYENENEKIIVLYALLCHDIGKVVTSVLVNGRIRSPGHAQEGAKLARLLLKRIMDNQERIHAVVLLVDYHMEPVQFVKQKAGLGAYKRLAKKISPLPLTMLAKVARADKSGRNPLGHEPLSTVIPEVDIFLATAEKAGVLLQPEKPLLSGSDLMDIIAPGPFLGKVLKKAYELQLKEDGISKQELKKRMIDLLEEKYFS